MAVKTVIETFPSVPSYQKTITTYCCDFCEKEFRDKYAYDIHTNVHHILPSIETKTILGEIFYKIENEKNASIVLKYAENSYENDDMSIDEKSYCGPNWYKIIYDELPVDFYLKSLESFETSLKRADDIIKDWEYKKQVYNSISKEMKIDQSKT